MKIRNTTITLLLLSSMFLMLRPQLAQTQQPNTPSAFRLFNQMIAAYESCQSYLDMGRVQTVFLTKQGRRTVVKPFSTAFVRPDAFRFEFQSRRGEEEWDRYIVWKQGTAVKSLWTMNKQEREFGQLSLALAGALGVSSRASHIIPILLMPDSINSESLKTLKELKLLGEEPVEKRAAYKIEGQDFRGVTMTVWLDKESQLILKVFQKNKVEPVNGGESFETETTFFYEPQINAKVPAARLEFVSVITK